MTLKPKMCIRDRYIVQALSKKGSSKVFIELDPYKSFPAPKIGFIPRIEKPHIEENYMAKMDQKYTIENGMRVYNLAEVIVTARRERAVKTESPFYSVGTSKVLTEEDVKKGHFISTYDLLRRLPGITVTNNEAVSYTHLDVYKRQRYPMPTSLMEPEA